MSTATITFEDTPEGEITINVTYGENGSADGHDPASLAHRWASMAMGMLLREVGEIEDGRDD